MTDKHKLEQQLENILVAQAMMADIPNSAIYPKLSAFANDTMRRLGPHACGSAACFGGWVAVHPHFQAQGVTPAHNGAPEFANDVWAEVDVELFGQGGLFEPADRGGQGWERAVINKRLKNALNELLEKK